MSNMLSSRPAQSEQERMASMAKRGLSVFLPDPPDDSIGEISYDHALIQWNAHKVGAARAHREPSQYFFPDMSVAQVMLERLGEERRLDQRAIDLAVIRIDVYATLCRDQHEGWEKTRHTRRRHQQLSRSEPELWQASDELVLYYIAEHHKHRSDALAFGPVTIDPSNAPTRS